MEIFRRIFFVAVLAGAVAGLFSSAMQQWRVTPLILAAEQFEGEALTNGGGIAVGSANMENAITPHGHESVEAAETAHAHPSDVAPAPQAEPWAPADGVQRTVFTALSTLLVSMGFAFLLAGFSVFTQIEVTMKNSLLWGLSGFLAFSMMPAIGLPPELPGMEAADLDMRKIWWIVTALASIGAILLVVKVKYPLGILLGFALLIAPHIVGAPQPPDTVSDVPAHLATAFAANALFVSLAFWLILCSGYAWVNTRVLKD